MSSKNTAKGRVAAASNPITDGVIWKQILFFFFPLLLSSFFQQLYNTADALIVGQTAGKQALSAVGGPSGSLLNIFIMFFTGFSGGAAVPTARFFGAKKEDALLETIRVSLLICTAFGTLAAAICFGGAHSILTAMHTPADIFSPSLSYLHIVAFGLIPCALYNMGASALRAMCDSRRPLAVLIFTSLTNIALDLLFVASLHWGAPGAAAATTVCHLLSALLVLYFLKRSLAALTFSPSEDGPDTGQTALSPSEDGLDTGQTALSPSKDGPDTGQTALSPSEDGSDTGKRSFSSSKSDRIEKTVTPGTRRSAAAKARLGRAAHYYRRYVPRDIARRILQMGLPLGFAEVMYSFANVILMSVVTELGTDTVAAYAAYIKIDALFWLIVGSFGISITTFVSQNIGAGRWDRVMQSIRECSVMMFAILGVIIFILYYFAYPLQNLFCTDPDVVRIGTHMMHFLMPFYFLYIPIEILFGSLRGMGDSFIPTLITFFGICVLRSAWGLFIVPMYHTIEMILLGFPVTWIVCDIAFLLYFRMYLRKNKQKAG